MTIEELIAVAHANAVAHGWWDEDREPGTILMLIVSELAEALEELRDGHPLQEIRFGPDGKQPAAGAGDHVEAGVQRGATLQARQGAVTRPPIFALDNLPDTWYTHIRRYTVTEEQ